MDGYNSAECSDDDGDINAEGGICVFPELVTKLINCDVCIVCTGKTKRPLRHRTAMHKYCCSIQGLR